MNTESRNLSFFPISLFSSTMGLAGLALAFMAASEILGITPWLHQVLGLITLAVFSVISIAYLTKILLHWTAFKGELANPMALPFFPTFSISLLLLSMMFSSYSPGVAAVFWYLGAGLQLALTFYILNQWIHAEHWQMPQLTPVWFLPVVGNIIAPIGAISFASVEVAWFFFSIGLVFWLILKSLIIYRLTFHPALANPIKPTLFIFIAPPAMGFMSYVALNEFVLDGFAMMLYFTALFMTLLLFSQIQYFIKLPFTVSWWAYTFPLAAIANASFLMYEIHTSSWFGYIGAFLIALLSALILHISVKTIILIKNKQLCATPTPKV